MDNLIFVISELTETQLLDNDMHNKIITVKAGLIGITEHIQGNFIKF